MIGCTFKRDMKEIWKKGGKEKSIAIPAFQQSFCLLVWHHVQPVFELWNKSSDGNSFAHKYDNYSCFYTV